MPDDTAQQPQRQSFAEPAVPPIKPRRRRRRWLRPLLLLLGPLVVAAAAGYAYLAGGRYVDTDNAYVKADKVTVSVQVAGPIVDVAVKENQHVDAGQVLFRVDPSPYKVALARAEAKLRATVVDIAALKSTYAQRAEELRLARVDAGFAEREYKRQAELTKRKVAPAAKLDAAQHDQDAARQRIAVAQQAMRAIEAQLGGSPDVPPEQVPDYQEALADVDAARLDLQHATVTAPFAGVVSKVPQPGAYLTPGAAVLALVADRQVWVEANFKETDLTLVRPGQPATVEIDTYPGRVWHGTVASISPASGAEFAVLPPQNATGNWVKVVQRIPVRVTVPAEDGAPPLRAGMSALVEIDTGHTRSLAGLFSGWFGQARAATP